ncbi:glycosyl hydrolase family 18 protein [Lucifera butyrica]|uniref:glycosyl hydrolase family 18 protein n=1 Tax=Lucifera butyrica TaxID=1351585 RepID=UPI001A9FD9F0|nr:glycosyl hydrolase family 18 protein [Lucifera butyrica]
MLIVFLAAVFMAFGGCAKKPAPKPLPGTPGSMFSHPRIVVGYYENPWPGTSDVTGSFPSMKANYKSISAVGPFWYRATKDGTLEAKDSQVVYNTARNLGLKVYPLVTNKSGATDDILGDPTTRSKVIDNIVKLVQEKKYDGINIDFELLPPKHRDNLTAFMAELYPKMKAINKTLIISVFPQVDVAKDVSGAYNYPELAKSADYLQIMTYDHHYSNSPPGPIAAIDWYEKNVKYAIDQCGAQKILVGVGVYGYDWPPSGDAETVTYADAITRAKKAGVKILYDDNNQAPHFKYNDHEVWFEDDKSVGAKLDVVAKYNPAGIAIWRLGQEQPEVWKVINEKFPK